MTEEKKPLISVLMGVYNCKERSMLERSVCSIVEQTYPNWELILCDDGSTNAALLWMQNLAARDSRIRLLQNDRNLGLARTLNRCLSVANGAYLARQDDDDISKPDRFEKQIAYLESHADVDFVGSNCDLYTPDGGVSGCWKRPERPRKQDFLFNSPFIHGSILFRRRCFEKVSGYPVMEKIARYEDYMLFMQLYAAGLQGANLQECLYQYYFDSKTRRIPVRERLDEAIVRWRGFHMLNLMPKGLPYIGKPLMLAMLPPKLIHHMHS